MAKKKKSLEELLEEALVSIDEQPHEVPGNWVWTKVTCVNEVVTGNTPSKNKKEYYGKYMPFVKPNDLNQGRWFSGSTEYLSKEGVKYSRVVPKGSTSICCIGSIGKTAYLNVDSTTNQQINTLVPTRKIENLYTYYYSLSPEFQYLLNKNSSATTISIINKTRVSELSYPLAPSLEQQRIVNKIESLFSKIDRAKELIEEAREGFENRKSAILAKAFRGELTKKWRDENSDIESSECLFEKIKKQKSENKVNKKTKVTGDEIIEAPYELPEKWRCTKLGQILKITSGGTPSRTRKEYYEGNIPWIKTGEIKWNEIYDSQEHITEEAINNSSAKLLPKDTVVVAMYGQGLTRGRAGILKMEATCNQAVCALICNEYISNKYIYYFFMEGYWKFREKAQGGNQPNFSAKMISEFIIQVPPLEEQKEIVRILDKLLEEESKIEELIQLEDQIELLKKSILAKAFRGELGTNDSTEESAIELLKEVLKEKVK